MKCPRCDKPLGEVKFDEIIVDRCGECFGVWFDFAELERILNRDAHAMATLVPEEDLPAVGDVDTLPCPRCAERLICFRAEPEGILYYTCLTCYGRWLDGRELQRVSGRSLASKFERVFRMLLDVT